MLQGTLDKWISSNRPYGLALCAQFLMIVYHTPFRSSVGADDGESKRRWQSFYMSSFTIAVLSQVFSSVFITKQQSQEGVQSWLQLLDDKVQHSRGWVVNLSFFFFFRCSDSFWQAGKCSINLKAGVCLWNVCMCWWKRLAKLWYECVKWTIKCHGTDCGHVRQWLICLFWGY